MPTKAPSPIPTEIGNLLAGVYHFAQSGDLGVLSVTDKATGQPRFALMARDPKDGGLIPLGYLSADVIDEVDPPEGIDAPASKPVVTLKPEVHPTEIPMDDYRATMIAEGVEEVADEETYLAAWQHLEDTGLGYKLQGWFGRMLHTLIAEGRITPRTKSEEAA